jgi:hypothetical protein
MSDGQYCVIRNLEPVKGGMGVKHHEDVVNFTWRVFVRLVLLRRRRRALQAVQTKIVPYARDNRNADLYYRHWPQSSI